MTSRPLPRVTYWVMYNETSPRSGQPGDVQSRNQQHYGTADLETAKSTVLKLRDHASQGKHFLSSRQWPNHVINSAWIEVETRDAYPF